MFLLSGALIGGISGVLMVEVMTSAIGAQSAGYGFLLTITMPVLLCLALLVFVASYIPARKLVAFEPGEALQYE